MKKTATEIKPAKSGRIDTKKPNKSNVPKKDKPVVVSDSDRAAAAVLRKFGPVTTSRVSPIAGVTDKPGEVTVQVGPYGTQTVAEQEAIQFKHPQVFAYRSAVFPLPTSHGVKVTMLSAEVVKSAGKNKNPLNPFNVELKMKVDGPAAKVKSWITSLRNRVKGMPA